MEIKPARKDLKEFIKERNLIKKGEKAKRLFETNIRHPSLEVELLETKWRRIYSFRLNQKY